MTTTTDNRIEFSDEATVVLPRRPLPQAPQGYPAPAPGYGYGFPQGGGVPPVGPFGPQAPFGQPAPQRGPKISRNGWIGIGGAVALVVAMVVAIVAGTSAVGGSSQAARSTTTAPSTAAEAPAADKALGVADLKGLLLSPRESAAALDKPGTVATAKVGKLHTELMPDATLTGNPLCQAMNLDGIESAYRGTGYTGARTLYTGNKSDQIEAQWLLSQTVVAYPSAKAAGDALGTLLNAWHGCEKPFTTVEKGQSGPTNVTWTPGSVDVADGLATVMVTQEGGEGWGCWRGLTTVANVVVDFSACGADMPGSVATATAAAITGKVQTL